MTIGFCFINPINNWLNDYWNIYTKNKATFISFFSFHTNTLSLLLKFVLESNQDISHILLINSPSGGSILPILDLNTLSNYITKIKNPVISNDTIIIIDLKTIHKLKKTDFKITNWKNLKQKLFDFLSFDNLPDVNAIYNFESTKNTLDNKQISFIRKKGFLFVDNINDKTEISYNIFSEDLNQKFIIPIKESSSNNHFPTYREILLYRPPRQFQNLSFIPKDTDLDKEYISTSLIPKKTQKLGNNDIEIYLSNSDSENNSENNSETSLDANSSDASDYTNTSSDVKVVSSPPALRINKNEKLKEITNKSDNKKNIEIIKNNDSTLSEQEKYFDVLIK